MIRFQLFCYHVSDILRDLWLMAQAGGAVALLVLWFFIEAVRDFILDCIHGKQD